MLDKKGESQGAGTEPQNKGAGNTNPSDFDDFEDEIPFN